MNGRQKRKLIVLNNLLEKFVVNVNKTKLVLYLTKFLGLLKNGGIFVVRKCPRINYRLGSLCRIR